MSILRTTSPSSSSSSVRSANIIIIIINGQVWVIRSARAIGSVFNCSISKRANNFRAKKKSILPLLNCRAFDLTTKDIRVRWPWPWIHFGASSSCAHTTKYLLYLFRWFFSFSFSVLVLNILYYTAITFLHAKPLPHQRATHTHIQFISIYYLLWVCHTLIFRILPFDKYYTQPNQYIGIHCISQNKNIPKKKNESIVGVS